MKRLMALAAAVLAGPAAAQPAASPEKPDAAAIDAACASRRFETTIKLSVKGEAQPRESKVRICGTPGQSDADWARTLRDAAAKVEANPKLPASGKVQLLSALNAELAKLAIAAAPAAAPVISAPPAAIVPPLAPPAPVLRPLEPLPYAGLPPLPAPRPAPVAAARGLPSVPLVRPRLTIRCLGEIGGEGPCTELAREGRLIVRADEALGAGTSLRFVRRGEERGEVALAPLRKGQSRRVALPPEVCRGVVGSSLEVLTVTRASPASAGEIMDRLGPLNLRC